jgi:hypothetical protein
MERAQATLSLLQWIERTADRFNPILVKETRQALKSRQFTGTFMLLLVASLLVSFGGLALAGQNIDYQSSGSNFFVAYFAVLAFAIFVVVPFGAYRSLAAEQEERTFELLSITTLLPGQIVTGKLLTSMIQMFIYFSAIAPFMAFTYLLRGIDMPSILFVLVLAVAGSVGLSMVGLFMATFATRRGWQVLLSVVMITGLGFVTIGSVFLTMFIIEEVGGAFREPEFWLGMFGLFTVYVTVFALLFQLSIAQLTFESDNRSTRVRVVLLIQFLSGLAWAGWGWIMEGRGEREILAVLAGIGCAYWALAGSFLIAEPEGISQRVARQIPRRGLPRALFAVFFPGPGTGLAFVLVHLVLIVTMIGLAEATEKWSVVNYLARGTRGEATAVTLMMASYAFFYVGLGATLVRLVRRFRSLPAIGGAAITAILGAAGILVPNFFVLTMRPSHYQTYAFWQLSDPIATVDAFVSKPVFTAPVLWAPVVMAGFVLLLNLAAMAQAISKIRGQSQRAAVSQAIHPALLENRHAVPLPGSSTAPPPVAPELASLSDRVF